MFNGYKFNEKVFILMPLMHSENKADAATNLAASEECLADAKKEGNESMVGLFTFNLKFAVDHKTPIDKFGRYPTRNEVLGRKSTPEELEYLKTAGGWGQKSTKEEKKEPDTQAMKLTQE